MAMLHNQRVYFPSFICIPLFFHCSHASPIPFRLVSQSKEVKYFCRKGLRFPGTLPSQTSGKILGMCDKSACFIGSSTTSSTEEFHRWNQLWIKHVGCTPKPMKSGWTVLTCKKGWKIMVWSWRFHTSVTYLRIFNRYTDRNMKMIPTRSIIEKLHQRRFKSNHTLERSRLFLWAARLSQHQYILEGLWRYVAAEITSLDASIMGEKSPSNEHICCICFTANILVHVCK